MNAMLADEPALIAGMGMREWSLYKVKEAIKQYRTMLSDTEEAA